MTTWAIGLENFQRVKKAKLKLQGLTIIRGESNLGKSSVRRAFTSIVFGGFVTPKPKEGLLGYVTKDAPFSKISLKYNQTSIALEKGASRNLYKLDGVELPKGGRGTPELIKDLGFDDVSLNVSGQYEPLFIVGESLRSTTERINKLTGSDLFEVATSLTKVKIKKATIELSIKEEESKALIIKEKEEVTLLQMVSKHELLFKKKKLLLEYLNLLEIKTKTNLTLKRVLRYKKQWTQIATIKKFIELSYNKSELSHTYTLVNNLTTNLRKHSELEEYLHTCIESKELDNTLRLIGELRSGLNAYDLANTYIDSSNRKLELKSLTRDNERSQLEIRKGLKKHTCETCGVIHGTGEHLE